VRLQALDVSRGAVCVTRAGTYSSTPSASTFSIGTAHPANASATACLIGPAGTFSLGKRCGDAKRFYPNCNRTTLPTECLSCRVGTSSQLGSSKCVVCQVNTYSNMSRSASCDTCPQDSESPAGGATIADCICVEGFGQGVKTE